MNSSRQLQHLYWRAGFGPRPQDVAAGLSPRKALRQLLHDSEKYAPLVGPGLSYADPQGMVMTTPNQPALAGTPAATVPRLRRAELTPEQHKMQNQGLREAFSNMSTAWMDRLAASSAQLREKMTLFLHGHFACRVRQPNAAPGPVNLDQGDLHHQVNFRSICASVLKDWLGADDTAILGTGFERIHGLV